MTRINWIAAVATCGALVAAPAIASEIDFRYSKSLKLTPLAGEELLAAPLDSDVYAATRDGLPDVRVQAATPTGETQVVSYLLRRATTTKSDTSRDYWTARNPSIKRLPDNALEITLQLDDKDQPPEGVRILSPFDNFEQRVRVFSSPDGQSWQPLGDDGVLFDYSQYMDVRNDVVPFPATSDRHFRIVIDEITQELESQLVDLTRRMQEGVEQYRDERTAILRRPFRIDRIEFYRDVPREHVAGDLKVTYPVANFRVEHDPKQNQTILTFDTRREPLTSVTLETKSSNFSRRAWVEIAPSTPGDSTWKTIGSGHISRLTFGKLDRNELAISFPETRATTYRVRIENRESTPLVINGVHAEGNQYQLVFVASPPARTPEDAGDTERVDYFLLYGNETADAPDYDVAAITALLADGYQPKTVTLGEQAEFGDVVVSTFTVRDVLNDGRILGVVAVILVAALAWGLYRAGQRLDKLPQDEH